VHRIEKIFTDIGGTFAVSAEMFLGKLNRIKAFIFDWDGVFNGGEKNENGSSNFSEVDSMGINMLRYSSWLIHHKLPLTAVISGERNQAAFHFCSREHFHGCYSKVMHKMEALYHFCKQHGITHEEVAYVFDDVLDISMARMCGLRILVNRKSNPLFTAYIQTHNLADYITGAESGNFAVRETCELMIGIYGKYDDAISGRSSNAESYRNYLEKKKQVSTGFFSGATGKIVEQLP